jgi:hypothetical protein
MVARRRRLPSPAGWLSASAHATNAVAAPADVSPYPRLSSQPCDLQTLIPHSPTPDHDPRPPHRLVVNSKRHDGSRHESNIHDYCFYHPSSDRHRAWGVPGACSGAGGGPAAAQPHTHAHTAGAMGRTRRVPGRGEGRPSALYIACVNACALSPPGRRALPLPSSVIFTPFDRSHHLGFWPESAAHTNHDRPLTPRLHHLRSHRRTPPAASASHSPSGSAAAGAPARCPAGCPWFTSSAAPSPRPR